MTTDDEDEDIETEETPEPPAPPKVAKRVGRPPKAVGAAAPMPGGKFERAGSNEADIVWNQLVEWLPTSNDVGLPTRSPYDVMMTVKRIHPPAPSGEAQPIGRGFSGSAVMGGPNELPGNSLINFVMKYYHLPTTDQPASYDIAFWKKGTGGQITSGRLPMPSGPECRAALRAGEQALQAEGGGPGLGWPQSQQTPGWPPQQQQPHGYPQQQQQPGFPGYPPFGYGAPPQGPDPAMAQQLAYLSGALNEALAAAREGRQPMIAPPPPLGAAAPPAPAIDEDRIVAKVLMALRGAGIGVPAPLPAQVVTAPVPAVPPTANGLGQMVERAMMGMAENLFKTAMGAVEKNIKAGMGVGAPPLEEEEEEETPPAPVVPERPEDIVPWKIAAVGAEWGNKSPVNVAINKETGDIDPLGLAFANPAVAEKLIDTINGLGAALQEGIKKFVSGTAARPAPIPQQLGMGQPTFAPPAYAPPAFAPPPPSVPTPPAITGGGWGPPPTPPMPPPPVPPPPAPPPPV